MADLYIGGDSHESKSKEYISVVNPTTEEEIGAVPIATRGEINRALDAASEAQQEWRLVPADDRGEYVSEIATALENRASEVADLLVREVGKPRRAAEEEVAGSVDLVKYISEWDRRIEGDIVPGDTPRESIHLQRHPHGVVAAISPWNFPVMVTLRKIAPALVTGNTVVLKPSEVAPLSVMRLIQIIDEEVDLPAGVLNFVTGGGEVGERLVTHRQTDMITMTGSRETGKIIMSQAADHLTPISLELGGKAPALVMSDADIDAAVNDLLTARIVNAGQGCACAERLYVHSDVSDEFTDKYVAAMEDVELGDPSNDADMGPQVSRAQLEKTTGAVQRAKDQGAEVLTGGGQPTDQFQAGFYYKPTVLKNVTQDMEVIQKEVFGPVSPIIEIDSIEQALGYANDSQYGLSSYIFTSDYQTAMRLAEDLDFGETYINRSVGESWQGHHIGWNESGLGGEDGKYGVLKYTQIKTVYHNYS